FKTAPTPALAPLPLHDALPTSRDDPPVAAVVAPSRRDEHTASGRFGHLGHEHLDHGPACRLHQHATRHPVLGARRRIPRCRLARREHRNWIHGITTPAYPTTRALSPDTQPEWR